MDQVLVQFQNASIDIAKSYRRAMEENLTQICSLNQISTSNNYSYRFINEPNVLSKFKKIAEDFLKEIGLTTFVKRTDNLKENLKDLNTYIQNYLRTIYLLKRCNLQLDESFQSRPVNKTSVCKECILLLKGYILNDQDQYFFTILSESIQISHQLSTQENSQVTTLLEFLKTFEQKQFDIFYNRDFGLYELKVIEKAQTKQLYDQFIQFFKDQAIKFALEQKDNIEQECQSNIIAYIKICQNRVEEFIGIINKHLRQYSSQIKEDLYKKYYHNISLIQRGSKYFFEVSDVSKKSIQTEFYRVVKQNSIAFDQFKNQFISFMTDLNQQILSQQSSNPSVPDQKIKDFYDNFTELFSKTDYIVNEIMEKDSEMSQIQHNLIEKLLNEIEESPQYLAKYCDIIMKVNTNDQSQTKIQNDVKRLFQLLHSKDAFSQEYKKLLKNRILQQLTVNYQAESGLIQKMISVEGASNLKMLQEMLNDVDISNQFMEKYSLVAEIKKECKLDFGSLQLNQNFWQFKTKTQDYRLPDQMEKATKIFEKSFFELYQDREFQWSFLESSGENNKKETYYIKLMTMQIIIFCQFNTQKQWIVKDLKEKVRCNQMDMEIALNPLIKAKLILREENELTEYKECELLTLNLKFNQKNRKLKLFPSNLTKPHRLLEMEKEQEEEKKQLEWSRNCQIEAIIVRIMKSRKILAHSELSQQCMTNIKQFIPQPQQIKKSIENLINRDYLKRQENQIDTYEYLN